MTSTLPSIRFGATVFALSMAFATAPARADGPPREDAGPHWGLGVGVVSETSPYRGVGTDTTVLPALVFENRYVRWLGPSLDVKLPSAGPVSFALSARYADDGYKASDAAELQGMAERKDGFWLGAKSKWGTPWADVTVSTMGDASSRSGGQQFKLEASRGFAMGGHVRLEPRLSLVWLDRSYVDYYYGVGTLEATNGRPTHAGNATRNTELGLRLNARLAPGHSLMADFKHTALGSGIRTSPLVGRNGVAAVFVAYIHLF